MTKEALRQYATEAGSLLFSRHSMRFSGDTMSNYGVREKPVWITTRSGETHLCWELYRTNTVRYGWDSSAFFRVGTFKRSYIAD